MHHRSLVRLGVPLLVAALSATACGSRGNSGPSQGSTGNTQIVKIGVIAPLSGSENAQGNGMANAVELAVDQANANHTVPGVTFVLDKQDDQATAGTSKQVAQNLISDPQVLAIIGTLNSSTAAADLPTVSQAKLLMISPANTNPGLTQGPNWQTSKQRQYPNYFRTPTTDAIQGPYAAKYVHDTLHITKVATVSDQQDYGVGLVNTFTKEFTSLGGQIVDNDTVTVGQKDFSGVVGKVKTSGAQLLYYGGQYPEAAPLSAQLKQAGAAIPLMGGDGIVDPTFQQLGGASVNGDYATSVGAPVDSLATAKAFTTAYEAQFHNTGWSTYGALAFDAANAAIDSIKAAKTGNGLPTRDEVSKACQNVSFDGVTGHVAFDQYGDTTTKVLTVYKVVGPAWDPVTTGNF